MKTRNLVLGFLTAALLIAPAAAIAHAGEDHAVAGDAKGPPHGGTVVDLGDVHAEVEFGTNALNVYFFDAAMKPMPAPASGKLTLASGGKVQKVELVPNGDHLTAPAGSPASGRAARWSRRCAATMGATWRATA